MWARNSLPVFRSAGLPIEEKQEEIQKVRDAKTSPSLLVGQGKAKTGRINPPPTKTINQKLIYKRRKLHVRTKRTN